MFDNPILKMFMDRYGHIEDLDQLQDAMSRNFSVGPMATTFA
jgi:hypothetical protein